MRVIIVHLDIFDCIYQKPTNIFAADKFRTIQNAIVATMGSVWNCNYEAKHSYGLYSVTGQGTTEYSCLCF